MTIRTLSRRHRGFIVFIWFTLGLGVAVAMAAFRLVQVEKVWPLALSPLIQAHAIPDTVWNNAWSAEAITPAETQAASVRALLGVLLSLAVAAAVMAVINAIAMVVARQIARRREYAIRAALGAGRERLRRERLAESFFLYGVALLLAAAGAVLLSSILRWTWPQGLELSQPWGLPGAALLVALLITALLFLFNGGGAREKTLRAELSRGAATADTHTRFQGQIPVIIGMALALAVASTTASLFRHGRLDTVHTVTEPAALVTLELSSTARAPRERALAYATMLERVRELPGVSAETLASPGAWFGLGIRDEVMVECGRCYRGLMYMPLQAVFVAHHAVSPGFFEALGIALVEGRSFEHSDTFDSARVAMVNRTFARQSFENDQPIGRRIQLGGMRGSWYTIVGVVEDVPARGVGAPRITVPALYVSTQQQPPTTVGLAARTPMEPTELAARVQGSVRDVAVSDIQDAVSMETRMERAVAPLRWFALLFAIIAAAAGSLALHGVFALVRSQVRSRQRELAVRTAVGAAPMALFRLVMGGTLRTVAVAIALGAVAAWATGRAIQMKIGGVPPIDLESAALLALILCAAAFAGALPTATRAAHMPAALVLRND